MTQEPKEATAADAYVEQRLADLMTPPEGAMSMWGGGPVILRLPYAARTIGEVPDSLTTDLFDVYLTRQSIWQDPSSRRNWESTVPWWREKFQAVSARPLFLHDDGSPTYFNEVKVRCYVQSYYELAAKLLRVDADLEVSTDEASITYLIHQRAQHVAVLDRAQHYIQQCLRAALQDPKFVYRGEGRWPARVPGVDCARAMPVAGVEMVLPNTDEVYRMRRYVYGQ